MLKCATCGNTEEFYREWTTVVWVPVNNQDQWTDLDPRIGTLEDIDSDLHCEMCDSTSIGEN